MNRLEEMNEISQDFLGSLLEKRKEKANQYFIKESRVWKYKFRNLLVPFIE